MQSRAEPAGGPQRMWGVLKKGIKQKPPRRVKGNLSQGAWVLQGALILKGGKSTTIMYYKGNKQTEA